MEVLIQPSNSSLGNLFFDRTGFSVPNYQRSYSWKLKNVKAFWDDIEYCAQQKLLAKPVSHFFGQIIKILISTNTNGLEEYSIIDGQQRITTLIILCVSLAKKCDYIKKKNENKKIIKQATMIYDNIYSKYLYYTLVGDPTLRLLLQNNDRTFFQGLVNSSIANLAPPSPDKDRQSQKLMFEALEYFNFKLDKIGLEDEEMLKFFDSLLASLNDDSQLIELKVESKIGVQHLFTTVNDRGLNLTTGELLKAKCIEVLQNNRTYQNECEVLWDLILSNDASLAENYLTYYFGSKIGRQNNKFTMYEHYLASIFPMCQKRNISTLEENQLIEEIRQLQSSVDIIKTLLQGKWPYPISDTSPCLWKRNRLNILINGLQCKSVIPLLLSAKIFLEERSFYELVSLCELNYFNTVSINSPNRYTKFTDVMFEQAIIIRNMKMSYKRKKLSDAFISLRKKEKYDESFDKKLKEMNYKTSSSNTTSRYFLYMMEQYYNAFPSTGGYNEPDDAMTMDFFAISTEHIYGQSLLDEDKEEDIENVKNRIGNLCAYGKGKNSKLGNKKFIDKKVKYASSGYKVASELSKLSAFTIDEYNNLANRYCEIAHKLFVDNLGI
ncbi:MAG: DUF262 domain-containing HNH endonuclease family protein [Clostridia bacterium]